MRTAAASSKLSLVLLKVIAMCNVWRYLKAFSGCLFFPRLFDLSKSKLPAGFWFDFLKVYD